MSPERRWRINHWSPWGTDASGITNYNEHLLPELAKFVDVTVVHPLAVDSRFRVRRPWEVAAINLDYADLNVFHLGNNLNFHHWMLGPLLRQGGIVVLHDWGLFDMVRPLFQRSLHLWERELEANGETDPLIHEHRNDPGFLMAHPFNRRFLLAADVVVTHSEWIRDYAKNLYADLDIRYVPLAGPSLPQAPMSPNAAFTVLGGIGRHKKIEYAVDAFAQVAADFPSARLRIVGRGDDRYEINRLKEQAASLGVAEQVEWHLNVDRATYLRLLDEALFVITMREETAGEMSGVMVETWGAGRVAVTSDQPQFRCFDDRYCKRLSRGPDAPGELAAVMRDAMADPQKYQRDGAAARELIHNELSFPLVAQQHAAIINDVAQRRPHDVIGGMNVYGSWGTPSGIAEVARRIAECLIDADVPITTPSGFHLKPYDHRAVPLKIATVPKSPQFAINLVTANINEFHEVDPDILGSDRNRRWNIGLWIYEFPQIPHVLANRVKLIDEIWTGSDFAATTFRRYFDGPIMRLHNVVRARPQTHSVADVRSKWGLRHDAVVVLYSFDFGSGWARKNPLAVVRAFRDALASSPDVNAQLVLKASGLTREYRAILESELATTDAVLIDDHMTDLDLGDLFHAIDVYCSLHRAEGFGLGMAEAMVLGKTVIGTRYSGNLDFMTDANSLLVTCSMTKMTPADAVANPGLERIVTMGSPWAEPSHRAAVAALRESFRPEVRQQLGPQARHDLSTRFSGEAAARIIERRLGELHSSLLRFRTDWSVRN